MFSCLVGWKEEVTDLGEGPLDDHLEGISVGFSILKFLSSMSPGRYNLPSEYIRNSVLILLSSQAVVRQNTVHTSSYAARFEVCKPGTFFLVVGEEMMWTKSGPPILFTSGGYKALKANPITYI